MEVVDSTLVRHLLAQQLTTFFVPALDNIHPRSCPSAGVKACTYARWFQQPISARIKAPLLHLALPPSTLRLSFRILSGCSGLPIDTGRRRRPFPIPRAQRFCLKCASQSVCDELYVTVECTALAPIRAQFSTLFRLHNSCSDSCGRRTHMRGPCLWLVACGIWTLQIRSILS
jgi:hypothetical protein